ncbi:HTH domain-containing protein [Candidatus Pacearchaeota archaeon]|jgi:predicted ArsR family transcriptional regulator|nr:HTH domain-containing protein [Candidatus Pacearchaeota archaeon]
MKKRDPLEIKKKILEVLKEYKEMSLRELDIKVNTSYQTIRKQIKELEFFGKVEVIKHKKSEKTGRAYTSVRLKNI